MAMLVMGLSVTSVAQERLSLEQCHEQALKANKNVLVSKEKQVQADEMKKIALDQFFPKVSANGTSLWSEKEVSLLSNDQQNQLNNMGTNLTNQIVNDLGNGPIANYLAHTSYVQDITGRINGIGQDITDSFKTDTRAVYAGAVSFTQPVFMGGKIVALYDVASANSELQNLKNDKETQDILVQVDEYYWRVVSVEAKYKLAKQYCELLDTLDYQVNQMVDVGVATRSDYLKVQVKRNEAQMALTKAENGLSLSKMALAQLCGMDLDKDFVLEDSDLSLIGDLQQRDIDMSSVLESRTEMKMLQQAARMSDDGVKVARSTFMPNLVANGGYMVSNPNLFDGFSNTFGGMFYGGLVLNVPIAHPESFHSMKLAKSKQNEVQYQIEEAQQMIELQVNQVNQRLKEAHRRYEQAESSIQNAEENLRFANEAYNEGMAELTDLMGAQTAWQQAKSELIDAEIDVKLCSLYLKQAMGKRIVE